MSSVTNKLIGNLKHNSTGNSNSFINSNNVVCIDTSNNRIGINKKKPVCSIDISGEEDSHAIRVHHLHTINATINSLDVSNILLTSITGISFEATDICANTIFGNTIDCIDLSTRNLYIPKISVIDISTTSLDVSNGLRAGNIETNTLNVENTIRTGTLESNIFNISYGNFSTINVDISANIPECYVGKLSGENINCLNIETNQLTGSTIDCSSGHGFFDSLDVSDILTAGKIVSTDISTGTFFANSFTCKTMKVETGDERNIMLKGTDDRALIKNNAFFSRSSLESNIEKLRVINLTVTEKGKLDIEKRAKINVELGALIIPTYEAKNDDLQSRGGISFDTSNQALKISNGTDSTGAVEWINIAVGPVYASVVLETEIGGNEVSLNSDSNTWDIDSNVLNTTPSNNKKKYIPIKIIQNNTEVIEISNNRLIISNEENSVFEIHATVGIKFYNSVPGDVEPVVYTFGINSQNSVSPKIKSTAIAFDNSYNYGNSSIHCITTLSNYENNPVYFYIEADKTGGNLIFDEFNATIKKI